MRFIGGNIIHVLVRKTFVFLHFFSYFVSLARQRFASASARSWPIIASTSGVPASKALNAYAEVRQNHMG